MNLIVKDPVSHENFPSAHAAIAPDAPAILALPAKRTRTPFSGGVVKKLASLVLALLLTPAGFSAADPSDQSVHPVPANDATVSASTLDHDIKDFLTRELTAHVSDIKSLNPPPDRVLGALTTGEFSWGTFMRALAAYSELSGSRTIAGRDIPKMIGEMGLIEANRGEKSFAQLYAALALRHFGTDLNRNPVWQSLAPSGQQAWRSLLDPSRFYDREARRVINLPENYFGVAARVVTMDYQLGIITDRTFVDEVLDRAARQFTAGSLYADDALPAGRFDRYSNEYTRYVYEAAENVGRKDVMKALEPSLKTQMHLWWDVLSPDGYGYPWGRSLGAISYMDTLEIVAFLSAHPEFRPAPLPNLASAYNRAWQWLRGDVPEDSHLLSVFAFGRGNYSYIDKPREWQQTVGFFGKLAGAELLFAKSLSASGLSSFPANLDLPDVARFEFFRKDPARQFGVWLVRQGRLHFALPFVSGTQPGVSDYLSAPYGLPGFAAPVEQFVPVMMPYIELADGRVVVANGGADEITPSSDGLGVHAVWRRWAQFGLKAGQLVDPGLVADVTWRLDGNTLVRTESLSSAKVTKIRRFWLVVPTTAESYSTRFERGVRSDSFDSSAGSLVVTHGESPLSFSSFVRATGDNALGKSPLRYIPLYLELEANNVSLQPATPVTWTLTIAALPPATPPSVTPGVKPNPDVLH